MASMPLIPSTKRMLFFAGIQRPLEINIAGFVCASPGSKDVWLMMEKAFQALTTNLICLMVPFRYPSFRYIKLCVPTSRSYSLPAGSCLNMAAPPFPSVWTFFGFEVFWEKCASVVVVSLLVACSNTAARCGAVVSSSQGCSNPASTPSFQGYQTRWKAITAVTTERRTSHCCK
jgi:hypothetical protein